MRKLLATIILIMSTMSSSFALAESNDQNQQKYSFYVVTHSETGHDYWAVTQDGSRGLWFKESDIQGESLEENDTFKATLDENGRLISIEKYALQ